MPLSGLSDAIGIRVCATPVICYYFELLGDDELPDVLPLDVLLLGDELLGVLVDGVDGVLGIDGVLGVVGVDGGVVGGVVGGGIGQVALASITDPSGHVLVVGGTDVIGGVGGAGGGVNDWVHDGSVGFLVQSTVGAVAVVQLPVAHVVPLPFPPPDVGIDVLLGCIAADVLLGGLDIIDDMLDGFVKFVDVV